VIVRLLIWNLAESKTTIEELRESLPELAEPSTWVWNEASERLGAVVHDDELPEQVARVIELVGADPDVYEEFDTLVL
jgi:hypothetical protein